MPQFVHLHVHSQYSVLDGQASVQALVQKAMADGQPALALTDHGNMLGIKEYFNYVNKVNSKLPAGATPFKAIFGCEVYVANESLGEHTDKTDTGRHLILLAKNKTGYHNLVKIVSRAWTEGFYSHPRTDKADIAAHREGLICCSACLGGEIPRLILQGRLKEAQEQARWWHQTFGDDYYLELQRHKATALRANHETYELQQQVNTQLLRIAAEEGIKVVATNDVHFVNEDDAEAHERLICISTQKRIADEGRMLYSKQEWLKSSDQMHALFADVPQALDATLEIAAKVETYSIDHAPIMPFFAIPEEFGTEEQWRQRFTPRQIFDEFTRDENGREVLSPEEAQRKIDKLGGVDKLYRIKFEADYLASLAYKGARERYGDPLTPELQDRIRFELHIMKTMGFPGYFLIVQDFINVARHRLGVSVGPGRGSAAGSVVAYCLGITQVDPVKYDLLFERFLNPDRISLPDIDVDFDDDGRIRVLQYVTDKYGADNVAHIITYGTLGAKSAIRDCARVEGLPIPESNRLANMVPRHMPTDPATGKERADTLANCYKYVPEFLPELRSADPLVRNTLAYAGKLEGNVRNLGVHACGVIICRDKISDWVPVSTAVDKQEGRLLVTQYEGKVIEETGLIKMDFLGLKTLSIIQDAVRNIKQSRGIDIDPDKIPKDDAATYKLYCEGRTVGTFQFESAGMQKYLRELQPSTFEDMIAMNALYRPGPMDYIPEFIARKHGVTPIVYDIDEMKQYLADTYGVTVYQEQVMLLSRLLAGFTRGESDTLRKAMGKKMIEKMNHLKGKFLEGGQARGHDPKVLEKIWADWEKFASYAFNKSHATCYSWVAFQTAYLKAHYPAEYMAAVLSRNRSDLAKVTTFMDECKAMKVSVKGPDVNESYADFGVTPQGGDIRFGLAAIKGVGDNVVAAIIAARREAPSGRFASVCDFVERVPAAVLNKRTFEALALAGALDCFAPETKREDYFAKTGGANEENQGDLLLRYGKAFQASRHSQEASLFGDLMGDPEDEFNTSARPRLKAAPPWVDALKLEKERELVGMYLSAHPLDPYFMELHYGMASVKDKNEMDLTAEGAEITFGGMVTKFETRLTRKGANFGILTLEDYTGTTELRLFGQRYIDFAKYGQPGTPLMVTMRVEARYNGELSLEVVRMRLLEDVRGSLLRGVTVTATPAELTPQLATLLAECASRRPAKGTASGTLNVHLREPRTGRLLHLTSDASVPMDRALANILAEADVDFAFQRQ